MGLFNRIRADPGFVSPVRSDPTLLYLASKSLRKAANSSGVPIEFEQNRRGKFELFA